MPAAPLISEGRYASDWLKAESHVKDFSREQIVVVSGAGKVDTGTVLGKITNGSVTTGFTGTGNGVITMDGTTPVLAGAKPGAYTATVITAATNGGTFRVEDPDGNVIGDVAVGATFADDVKFVIADGSTDFIVGDKFTITVGAGSGKYKPVTMAAVDGSQIAAGILLNAVDATSADAPGVLIAREAIVVYQGLKYGADVTTSGNRATVQAALRALNPPILPREGA